MPTSIPINPSITAAASDAPPAATTSNGAAVDTYIARPLTEGSVIQRAHLVISWSFKVATLNHRLRLFTRRLHA